MQRDLSSAWTFTYKYLFLIVWAWVVVYLVRLWVHAPASVMNAATGHASPNPVWIVCPVLLLLVCAMLRMTVPLKRVRVGNDGTLLVSNFIKEWRVPASLITDVKQQKWIRTRPITVQLRSDVGFGTRFMFVPPQRLVYGFTPWREDPEAQEIRDMASESSAGWRSRLRARTGETGTAV